MIKNFKWLSPGAVPLMLTVLLIICKKMFWPDGLMKWIYLLFFALLLGWNILSLLWQIRTEKSMFRRFVQLMIFLLLSVGLTVVYYWMMREG